LNKLVETNLFNVLKNYDPTITRAYIINHIIKQGEDLYHILIEDKCILKI
jgi:hypothetical protein